MTAAKVNVQVVVRCRCARNPGALCRALVTAAHALRGEHPRSGRLAQLLVNRVAVDVRGAS